MRKLILIAALSILTACGSRAAPEVVDAGTRSSTFVLSAPLASPSAPSDRPVRARRPTKGGPPDSRIVECQHSAASDGATFTACLDKLKRPVAAQADAGHRLGAVRPPIINPSWGVTDWSFRPSTGSNDASGVDSAHAIKSCAELIARWGTDSPILTTTVTLHPLENWAQAQDMCTLKPTLAEGGVLNIQGVDITVSTGTLASVTPKNRNAHQALQATLNVASAVQGTKITNTTRGNSVAFVDEIVSGTTVILTQPDTNNPISIGDGQPPEIDTWANGDAYTASNPVKMNLARVSPISIGSTSFVSGAQVWIPQTVGLGPTGAFNYVYLDGVSLYESRVDMPIIHTGGQAVGTGNGYINDWLAVNQVLQTDTVWSGSTANWDIGPHTYIYGYSYIAGDVRMHSQMYWEPSDGQSFSDGVNFAADVSAVSVFGEVEVTGPWWSSAASWTLRSRNGGKVYCLPSTAAATFLGSVSLWVGGGIGTYVETWDPLASPIRRELRSLSISCLDTPFASGGCGGIAQTPGGIGGFFNLNNTQVAGPSTPTCASGQAIVYDDAGAFKNCTTPVTAPVPLTAIASCGTNGQIVQTVSGVQTCVTVSGDATIAAGGTVTLASVGSAGSCGSSTTSCVLTFDTNGRETARADTAIAGGGGVSSTDLQWEGQAVRIAAAGSGSGILACDKALATCELSQSDQTTDTAVSPITIQPQGAWPSAATNVNGGNLLLRGGDSKTPGTTGVRGGASLGIGSGTGLIEAEATEFSPTRRGLVIVNGGGSTQGNAGIAPSGNGIISIGSAANAPAMSTSGWGSSNVTLWSTGTSLDTMSAIQGSGGGFNFQDAVTLNPGVLSTDINTQARLHTRLVEFGRTTTSLGTMTYTTDVPTSVTRKVQLEILGKVAVASAGFTLDDAFGGTYIGYVVNHAGTAAVFSALTQVVVGSSGTMATTTVTLTFATSFMNVVITAPASATPPTTDWTMLIDFLDN